jgi:PucR family transcriptional regulator, purine catabolism regulatory protein
MPATPGREEMPAQSPFLEAFADVSAAVESGAGLPEVARATSRALEASVVVVDASGSVMAVACASPADERAVLAEGQVLELRVADATVGELRYRARGDLPPPAMVRMVGTLIGLEVERARVPERASEAAVAGFLRDLLDRKVTDRENIVARGHELGADLEQGASVVVARAHPQTPEEGDWRARVLAIVERGARGRASGALAAAIDWSAGGGRPRPGNHDGETVIVVPGPEPDRARRVADAVLRELDANLPAYQLAVAMSRPAADPADLHRAGAEALLAANVAEAQGTRLLAFEETGAYRILLPAMSEDPAELQRFHDETVAPLIAYDEQYDTELVRTLESFLDADGNVAKTAQKLYTHRHTIRYRLERVRELTGLDVSSTDGRERLGLGLKAMRVLGIAPPQGPAAEPGTQAGRVPLDEKDRF